MRFIRRLRARRRLARQQCRARITRLVERLGPWLQRFKRALPFLSFLTGVVSALLMKRGYSRMPWLLGALLLTWVVVGGVLLLQRRLSPERQLLGKMHFGAIVLAQSASQEVLFFVLPFYFWSTTFWSPNVLFLALLVLTVLATLVDPIFERMAARAPLVLVLLAVSTFATLNFALPVVIGIRNNWSLHISVAATIISTLLFAVYTHERGEAKGPRLKLLMATGAAMSVLLAGAIWVLDLQMAVPPAPLRLMDGAASHGVEEREPIDRCRRFALDQGLPPRIYCFTAIQAPRGLDEEIVHVWRHNGRDLNTVELKQISGGRQQGFRTWSFKSRFPRDPLGDWTCEVRTAGDQIIGRVRFEIVEHLDASTAGCVATPRNPAATTQPATAPASAD